jgi:hypothetical protein
MFAHSKHWLGNVALSAASLLAALVFLETVVFTHILVPDDLLDNLTINGVVRYAPNARAVFRHPDGTNTLVTVNAQGWNSTKPSYEQRNPAGNTRIAVIGDSYVHATQVNVEQAFPEVLERKLNDCGQSVEVYRFGMDGAPLSQYLHMLRREVLAYRPDIVVVQLIHNDFDESYRFLKTRYSSSFLKLERGPSGRVVEIAPTDFRPGGADLLRHFNTFRYLYYQTGLYLSAKSVVSRMFWGGNEDWQPEFISSAVDIRKITDHDSNRFFARYVLYEMKALARENGFRLAIAMDGVREAFYDGRDPATYEVGRLNQIAADVTRELDLPFLDLQGTFAADWAARHQRFEYSYDWHWNVAANELVAGAIARMLQDDPRIGLGQRNRAAEAHSPPTGG